MRMRRYVQISGLIMLAVMAGGWGSVLAAILCPHLNGDAMRAATLSSSLTEHGCHTAKPAAESKPHCHDSYMERESMGEMEEAAPVAEGPGEGAWLGLGDDSLCSHCMARSELPTSIVVARQQPEPRRVGPVAAQAAMPSVPAGYVICSTVLYRQGAPPRLLAPGHLLLGVLLI
jgi:hypothetical protein